MKTIVAIDIGYTSEIEQNICIHIAEMLFKMSVKTPETEIVWILRKIPPNKVMQVCVSGKKILINYKEEEHSFSFIKGLAYEKNTQIVIVVISSRYLRPENKIDTKKYPNVLFSCFNMEKKIQKRYEKMYSQNVVTL